MEDTDEKYAGEKEYMARTPSWLTRWGTTILSFSVVTLLSLTYFIPFPKLVEGNIEIKPNEEPKYVRVNKGVYLDSIIVFNHQQVKKGEVLAILKNDADYADILKVKSVVSETERYNELPQNSLVLGRLSDLYYQFETEFKNKNSHTFELIRNSLLDSIKKWEAQNLLFSPVDGKILFDEKGKIDLWLNKDDNVFVIYSRMASGFYGKMKIKPNHINKIAIGQKVVISLEGYPLETFGALIAKINNVSSIIQENDKIPYYYVGIQIDSLRTTHQKEIPFSNYLRGKGTITIKKESMLESLLSNSSE